AIAARMPAVGRVTVSLRMSMTDSAMIYSSHHSLLPILHVPTAVRIAEKQGHTVGIFQPHRRRGRFDLPFTVGEELGEPFAGRCILDESRRAFFDQGRETALRLLYPAIHPLGVGKLGEDVIDPLCFHSFQERSERLLRGGLRVSLQVRFQSISSRRRLVRS